MPNPTGQHTPGPWTCEQINDSAMGGWIIKVVDSRNSDIEYHYGLKVLGEANARLIASAPDLLAALQATLRCLVLHLEADANEHGLKHVGRVCPCWDNEVQQARVALQKAGVE